jgi:hypothetical protein
MISAPEPTKRRLTPEFVATLLILLAYIVFLLTLPAWPSQDGPVHLYYTHVLSALLSHQPTVYTRFYTIKHLLPPYALYYYALLALSKFVPLLLADRLILCVYLALFIFGFRYLAQAIGPGADRVTLLATLLALNWAAGIGFVNYCLSLALALWAIGLWLRLANKGLPARLLFLFLVAAITLTHPVPLLILMAFCGFDLLRRFLAERKRGTLAASLRLLRADLILLLLSALALLYVHHFAAAHPLADTEPITQSFLVRTAHHALAIAQLHHLSLVFGHSFPYLVYRFGQLALPLIAFALGIAQRLRNRAAGQWTSGDTWLIISIVLLIFIPFLPSDISGAFYFCERLSILIWLAPLLAASGWIPRPKDTAFRSPVPAALLSFALVTNLCLLWAADAVLRPLADQIAALKHAPSLPSGDLTLLLEDDRSGWNGTAAPAWAPFYWAGAHLLRYNDAVLDNSPWLDSAIIPLGATSALPVGSHAIGDSASPHELSLQLLHSPSVRTQVLSSAGVALITQSESQGPVASEPVLAPSPGAEKSWSCHLAARWYQLCVAHPAGEISSTSPPASMRDR